jgi:predicted RNA binding protein YcfA (HicA-like mRNA interferase family)
VFPSVKAKRVFAALVRIGWQVMSRKGYDDFVFAFHDGEEIGSRMLSRIAKKTGLIPEDL